MEITIIDILYAFVAGSIFTAIIIVGVSFYISK